MKIKTKFDKRKCAKCIYHGGSSASNIYCNYAGLTEETCLKRGPKSTTIDIRGEDYEGCLLFEQGKTMTKLNQIYVGSKRYEGRG